jgi:hypothetical protein
MVLSFKTPDQPASGNRRQPADAGSGEIPEPTVIVRMVEGSRNSCGLLCGHMPCVMTPEMRLVSRRLFSFRPESFE